MATHPFLCRAAAAFSLALLTGIVIHSIAAEPVADGQATVGPDLTATLGGPERYLTAASTDKPLYKPGETLYVRGVLLHHVTHEPVKGGQPQAVIEIKGPKGDTVASGTVQAEESVLGFSWKIPDGQAGGQYTLRINYPWTGDAAVERKFDVRAYRAPRLKSQVKFVRDGYGPGDEVTAGLSVERAEGGFPVGATVTAIARVDGVEVFRGPTTIDALGKCQASFRLPEEIQRGEGTLALVIDDSGIVETASKTIPILLQTVDLTMYPEGGDLVAGVPNRVYVEAFTPSKKPADLAGEVTDSAGQVVAKYRSEHEGRGRFELTPKAKEKYALRLTEPAGIKTIYDLPAVKSTGVVMTSLAAITTANEKVALRLASPQDGTFTVQLRQRDVLRAVTQVKLRAGEPSETLLDAKTAGGVLTATVFDAAGKPRAERLVFRQPAEQVNVSITADASRYVPGGKVSLKVDTCDGKGKPVPAVVGITVTDDSILEMIEKREQAPRLPVMVLLEPEVKELGDAHVYLDPENEKAPLAVDLLLGTQGWRRFATVDLPKFLVAHGEAGRRMLALKILTPEDVSAMPDAMRFDDRLVEREAIPAAPAGINELAQVAGMPVNQPVAEADPKPQGQEERPVIVAAPPVKDSLASESKERQQMAEALREARDDQMEGAFFDEISGKMLAAGGRARIRNDFVSVRVYAHDVRPGRHPGERKDFAETLYWSAGIKTDSSGTATVAFDLSDAVTSFRVAVDAFSGTGGLGIGTATIESVEPFYVEPKLPLQVTVGDRIALPLGIVNATTHPLHDVSLGFETPNALTLASNVPPLTIAADSRVRHLVTLDATEPGEGPLAITARGSGYSDKVVRPLTVHPRGFPVVRNGGGLLEPGAAVTTRIVIPADLVSGSLSSRVRVYPTPLASMTSAMEQLIREPCGCFEQTSSTTYPLVMAQRYFKSHQGVDPSLIAKSEEILSRGYDRLMGFESPTKGFEWFGADPGHDALTAYGLMQFTEMAQVRPVDADMLARTRAWLLAQRDGTGGYARKTHTLHTWITDEDCAAAYDTWALLVSGDQKGLDEEIAHAIDRGQNSKNTYAVALAANVAVLAHESAAASRLLDRLAAVQENDGSLRGATTSIVGSGGEALAIETTSLAVLGWLADPRYAENVEKAIEYLAACCKGGRFGSTQSTVLAVKAIVAYDESRAHPTAPGNIELRVDGQLVGEPVAIDVGMHDAIEFTSIDEILPPGDHEVELRMIGGSPMPCSVAVEFNRLKPETSEACKICLATKLRDTTLDEGATTEAEVIVTNETNAAVPNPVAIIGIPGGLEVRHDQVKELVKAGKIAAYEVIGRDLVLYWRSLAADERAELAISLVATVPGTYKGPASRAYLYYTDEDKRWVDGFEVEIMVKK